MKIAFLLVLACVRQLPDSSIVGSEETPTSIIERFASVEDGVPRFELYRLLFKRAVAGDGLRSLQTTKDDSIAIQSAWEQVMPNAEIEPEQSLPRPVTRQPNWFVGFFEGRTHVTPPKWWVDGIIDRDTGFANANKYGPDSNTVLYHPSGNSSFSCPVDASIEKVGEDYFYRVGSEKAKIPTYFLDQSRSFGGSKISGAFTKSHCFITAHNEVGSPHELVCIDRSTNKLQWKVLVCGAWWGGTSGQHESWVSIIPTNDERVFVFGSAATGSYAHGFRISDGKSLVQFSTGY